MLKNYTAKEVAEILDIEEISAQELLDGIIKWKAEELLLIAHAMGVSFEMLIA